ncbi:MAG: 50S ribosomal protein L9 [Planctomycetota bacterium]|jgi:large subunit ribosomal protein L9
MKVLLCEDVKDVGWLGDVVEVNDGYARNYLLPHGIAKAASESNLKSIAAEKAKHAEARITEEKRLKEAAEKVAGSEAVIAAKANEQGHLFGSVGQREIAGNLREQGFEVADEIVRLHDNIKEVGTHTVQLKYAPDMVVDVEVTVVAESVEEENTDPEEK